MFYIYTTPLLIKEDIHNRLLLDQHLHYCHINTNISQNMFGDAKQLLL